MSDLLVLQHIACEPPAAYEDELRAHGFDLARVELDRGEPLPDWRDFAGIVVMGGPMGAYEDDAFPWLAAEKALLGEAADAGHPVWGVCLGAQLLAASLGAEVRPGPKPEVGLLDVELDPAAAADPVFGGLPGASPRCSGTPTPSTCRRGLPCSPGRRPIRTRPSSAIAPTVSNSTSRSRRSWRPSGRRCPPTPRASRG